MDRRLALILVAAAFAGCYSPSLPNGKQQCGLNGACPSGYTCGPDNHCYKNGQVPTGGAKDMAVAAVDMAMACTAMSCKNGPKMFCDSGSGACVECITDDNCPSGKVCVNKACAPGCSMTHGCPDGGGMCDPNSKMCKACMKDADCGGNTPRCDTNSGLCVECLPTNDNCPQGRFCGQVNSVYTCQVGCQTVNDCPKSDGGGSPACCNHVCVDTDVDGKNCGACGTDCGNESCCGGQCSDVTMDLVNCGMCGNACSGKNAMWSCMKSMCNVASCSQGFGDCNGSSGDGCESTLATDSNNCGKCGNMCALPNAVAGCAGGMCTVGMCNMGFGDCNMAPNDGCETNLGGDINNCGKCGMKCALANATAACVKGGCVIAMCNNGFADCNNNPADGCETAITTDPNNCGGCNMKCPAVPNATVGCSGAKCVITGCSGTFKDCDAMEPDGCEVNVSSDKNNCGACGMTCPLGANVATETCANSACKVNTCNAGFADCNGTNADGCEINTNTDNSHCGNCATVCGANQTCTNGVCKLCLGGLGPPAVCAAGTDPETGAPYVICESDCNHAWISQSNGATGGSYHAVQICQKYGYTQMGMWDGDCGDVCGYCGNGNACNNVGPKMFSRAANTPNCGSDGNGGIYCNTVQWLCMP